MTTVPPNVDRVHFRLNETDHVLVISCYALRELLFKEYCRLMKRGYYWKKTPRVLVGRKTFFQITEGLTPEFDSVLLFRVDYDRFKYRPASIGGFDLYVLPWFDEGMIFLPEELDEKA